MWKVAYYVDDRWQFATYILDRTTAEYAATISFYNAIAIPLPTVG